MGVRLPKNLFAAMATASFVQEVLLATGRLGEKEDYAGKVSRLRASIDDLKVKSDVYQGPPKNLAKNWRFLLKLLLLFAKKIDRNISL
jgi:hypothetical protein